VNTVSGNGFADIILTTGSVSVYYQDSPDKKVILNPGEKARILTDGNEIDKSQNENLNYLAWKTGTLIFNGDPLSDIIPALNKFYHADIRLKGNNIERCQVTATFTGQSLGSVLNVLKATLDLQIKYTGATIELSGNDCR
jgi:transmembrane sensor